MENQTDIKYVSRIMDVLHEEMIKESREEIDKLDRSLNFLMLMLITTPVLAFTITHFIKMIGL